MKVEMERSRKSKKRNKKWLIANEREKSWWRRYVGSEQQKCMTKIVKARALFFENYIKINKLELKPHVKILEIGGAGLPVVNFFSFGVKCTLDPLAEDYKNLFADLYKDILLVGGKAESLPFIESCFDIVIILNALDHCENPDKVLAEIWRILRHNGVVLLSLNVTSSAPVLFRNILLKPILRRKYPDYIQHPYHFSVKQAMRLVKQRFEVISVLKDCYYMLSRAKDPKSFMRKPSVLFLVGKKLST